MGPFKVWIVASSNSYIPKDIKNFYLVGLPYVNTSVFLQNKKNEIQIESKIWYVFQCFKFLKLKFSRLEDIHGSRHLIPDNNTLAVGQILAKSVEFSKNQYDLARG